jgi:hypothetical protein
MGLSEVWLISPDLVQQQQPNMFEHECLCLQLLSSPLDSLSRCTDPAHPLTLFSVLFAGPSVHQPIQHLSHDCIAKFTLLRTIITFTITITAMHFWFHTDDISRILPAPPNNPNPIPTPTAESKPRNMTAAAAVRSREMIRPL